MVGSGFSRIRLAPLRLRMPISPLQTLQGCTCTKGRSRSKSQRSLPSKLRPFDAHVPTTALATKREMYEHFIIITADGLAVTRLESLHFSILIWPRKALSGEC